MALPTHQDDKTDGDIMSDTTNTGPVLAADGTPLKRSLNRALRQQKMRALMLIAPLLFFRPAVLHPPDRESDADPLGEQRYRCGYAPAYGG